MIYPGYWGKLNSQYRENNIVLDSTNSANDKLNQLAKYSSIALELDLSEHFERHGFWVSDETKELLSQYPKPDIKTWYANYDYIEYDGEGFTSNPELNVNVLKENENIKLSFSVNEEFKDDVLGYEIFKDGELIGFTSTNSFVDTESNIGESVNYTVVPYDKKLNIGEEVVVNSLTPSLSVEQESISIKLREEFDPMNLVKALNYNGEDISSNIVINGEVNVNEKGTYPLEYTIEDNGVVVTKTVNVQVVSNYDYLSDTAWTSITTQYGTPRRNSSIKGRVNNEIKTFDKGFGIHANGKITYDLSNVDYDYFEALVGIDMGIESQSNSSVVFKVIADGEVLATTSVIKHADNMVAINVPVKGVQELVIEVSDGGNGNTSDHAVIANPKLTTNNAKPDLTVTDKTYKLGEVVDFNEGISATDIEDGDLTSSIEIVSNTYEAEKVGRFEVTYRVSDSDNNVVEKISYITVYEELTTTKSKYGAFNNLEAYNEEFKIPVASISNNGGNYGSSVIGYAIDNNRNTHWETGNPNSLSFQNEVVFDLGEVNEIDKIAYAARNGGKGFATKFAIYVSNEAEGNDFRLAGTGSYNGSVNDVIEIDITKTEARRVKFKFIEANQNWASIGEMSFYKTDELSDKIKNELFTDDNKNEVSEQYNTLEKLNALREEVSAHPAEELFQDDLNRAEEIIRNKFPSLTVGETEYVKLRSEYDLMSSVNASDQEDGDITNKVVINSNNFTTNKTGDYKVSYTVTDSDGNIATSEKTIVVYSDSEYLSDIDWDSARTDYGQVRKDLASGGAKIKLSVNGEEKVFDKGIGTHANSEIVYNLEGKNYEYFETYVGIDRNIAQQNNSSVIFKVYADDVEIYNSGIMKWADDAKLVRIPLEGVSELKIVADNAGNGNASDHASFGDAKFLILNAAPTLSIPKSVSTKVGYPIELNEEYSASDAEDGDLTNNIEVAGEVNFNKAGKYELTYKVTDSDGNTTTKTRTIAVVDMNDYTYLTEYDWNSTNNSYTAPKKDISISGRALRLTGENGQEVSYERGIGSHSTSTIIYNLSDKDYAYFTSYIGVDRQMYGTVGSVSFEVWVDGEKKFDSGLMTSRDSQKYVEVDINGAKELKLVVTDGGNGNGSDHATWGDTKLHFANNNGFEINRAELDSLIETINNLNKDIYTGESIDNLQEVLEVVNVELANGYTQEEIDNLFIKLNEAYEKLEKAVDLSEVVNISDEYLKEAIKSELNISSNDITIGDMYNLTELNAMGYGISDLEGLQYAKNLETLNLDYNEINDLSKLKGLEKLFNLQAMYQNIVIGSLYKEDNKITVKYDAVNREGKTVELSAIVVRNNITLEDVSLHIDECVDENGVVSFDTTNFNKAYHTLYLVYEDKENNYLAQVTYMFDNR